MKLKSVILKNSTSMKGSMLNWHCGKDFVKNVVNSWSWHGLEKNNASTSKKVGKSLFSDDIFETIKKSIIFIVGTRCHHQSSSYSVTGICEESSNHITKIA